MASSHTVAEKLIHAKNEQAIGEILETQAQCLQMYKDTQQKLEAFNEFSKARYQNVHKHFEAHTKLLKEMRNDLNSVFSKLRKIKSQLQEKYPEEMDIALKKYPPIVIPDE
ncbi:uncharacterized protein BYT42DRAFT_615439 [Radiomyces spectabilis]|uniref:uncharacterized protein n=1 Tax=Radiomyces spectabilis TaxID=64574 RepID=UPI002220953A|nr:uncharacterized protein BYT42DRAFT_615439 [Radiomyces spectabilis]KAI8374264.1 hypothetical protein BYT42DRAFT_615439 [Radiomyces spectabilis]